jgi:hypothetical protein
MGKGSGRRPRFVSFEEYSENHDRIFGEKKGDRVDSEQDQEAGK